MDNKIGTMISRGLLLLTMVWLVNNNINAQQKYSLSAEQAAALALKNVTDIKNLQLDREIQIAKNREYISQAMPQINGSVQMQHFFSIPVTLLPDFISPSVY